VDPRELLGDVGVAVLAGPQPGDEELREAHHVQQWHATPHGAAQVGALRHRHTDEQPAVGAAEHGEAVTRGEVAGDEPVGGGVEVVEDVLLALAAPGVVPLVALLEAAAQPGDRVHPAGCAPRRDLG
jgi:hypothetical protein